MSVAAGHRQEHRAADGGRRAGAQQARATLDPAAALAVETKETIWVEVAGDEPKLTFDGFVQVHGLVFAPWVGRDGKIRRAFRADGVEPAGSGKAAVHAA